MKLISRLALLLITVALCLGADLSTKILAYTHLRAHASISFMDGPLYFAYAENPGTMLGIGSSLSERIRFLLFEVLFGVLLFAASLFVVLKPLRTAIVLGISLVVGGGVSNLVDRILHDGSVIDFILIKSGSLESGIFNVADIAISFGLCMFCFSWMRTKAKQG